MSNNSKTNTRKIWLNKEEACRPFKKSNIQLIRSSDKRVKENSNGGFIKDRQCLNAGIISPYIEKTDNLLHLLKNVYKEGKQA